MPLISDCESQASGSRYHKASPPPAMRMTSRPVLKAVSAAGIIRSGKILSFVLLAGFVAAAAAPAVSEHLFFREDFSDLDRWQPFFFPKIKKVSSYSSEDQGDGHYLRAQSDASASAIVYRERFNVYTYQNARWRWKVRNVYEKGDAETKAGDDFPIRIYIMFEYDPASAGFGERITYGLARRMYGEYPPHSSLSYAWASEKPSGTIITSPYTSRARSILLRHGPALAGTWQEEQINILRDYRKAFADKPPEWARVAIMNDSDNTGESSVSWVDYLEVFHRDR
ncbi:DUF3047 domain-containing protein [Thermodesulfobacteriota bacterium]